MAYAPLSAHVDRNVPIYGLQTPALTEEGFDAQTLSDYVYRYADEIMKVQTEVHTEFSGGRLAVFSRRVLRRGSRNWAER